MWFLVPRDGKVDKDLFRAVGSEELQKDARIEVGDQYVVDLLQFALFDYLLDGGAVYLDADDQFSGCCFA